MGAEGVNKQTESIQISQFWEEQLKAMPYLSSKYSLSTSYDRRVRRAVILHGFGGLFQTLILIPTLLLQRSRVRRFISSSQAPSPSNRERRERRLRSWEPSASSMTRRRNRSLQLSNNSRLPLCSSNRLRHSGAPQAKEIRRLCSSRSQTQSCLRRLLTPALSLKMT